MSSFSGDDLTRPKTVAETILAQATRRKAETSKIAPLPRTHLERSTDRTGKPVLTAVFPNPISNKPFRNDLSFLLEFPNLSDMFAEAYLIWGGSLENGTRRTTLNDLRRNFFGYLAENNLHLISPNEINEQVLAGFNAFLHRPRKNDQPFHPATIADSLGAIRKVLSSPETGPLAYLTAPIAERIPSGPVGSERKLDPVEVLSLEQMTAIVTCAEREIEVLFNRWEEGKQLLEQGRTELAMGSRDFRHSIALCLAVLDERYPGVVPNSAQILKDDSLLGWAVKDVHGLSNLWRYFYPTARDLIPFVILLSIITVFNPNTILTLDWSNVDEHFDRLGTPSIRIVGTKLRANYDIVRLLELGSGNSPGTNLSLMLKLLREITARLRPHIADPGHRDRLFVYMPQRSSNSPKSFGNLHSFIPTADCGLAFALTSFRNENKLEYFSLRQLRPTILDRALNLNGDLTAAQELGNHGSPHTTWTHYSSSGVRKGFQERLGEVILLRRRWVESDGKIDPRGLTQNQDRGSATPGFTCLDPFDSPRPNQLFGRSCNAYGECPACPLALPNPNEPSSVAKYYALRSAIIRSQTNMAPETWILRWAPILKDLVALLELVPNKVYEKSKQFQFFLPTVG